MIWANAVAALVAQQRIGGGAFLLDDDERRAAELVGDRVETGERLADLLGLAGLVTA